MRPLADLSHRIETGMPVFPGDPEVSVSPALEIERDVVAVSHLALGSHTGTHVDAPAHTVPGGRTMDRVGLDELVGPALVLHVPGLAAGERIGAGEVEGQVPERVPAIVVVATGWDRHFGADEYLRHPYLDAGLAAELVRRGMRVLAVDTLNPDPTLQEGAFRLPVHEAVLGADGLIVENLTGAAALPARAHLGFFPLRLGAVDGAPVRAVAFDTGASGPDAGAGPRSEPAPGPRS
ncbi:cyclase family protein [Arthrobacter halodurans]|uniref:Cyclase family protein n=1 Tax=Arthrobacter halodurans TaxID=516699 RepID=A0ABV4USV9_9MICC